MLALSARSGARTRSPWRWQCHGFERAYLEASPGLYEASRPWFGAKPPPAFELESLRAQLWGQRLPLEPVEAELKAVSETGHYASWSSRLDDTLRGFQRSASVIEGYRIDTARIGRRRANVQMRAAEDTFEIIVERASAAERFFIKGRQYALSTLGRGPLSERQEACRRALLERLEVARGDVQGTTH